MSGFYKLFPEVVLKSIYLSNDEKVLWCTISANLNNAGCCKMTNDELASAFRTSPRTIRNWLTALKEKGYLCVTQETHNHARRLYPKWPGELDVSLPTEEEMQIKIEQLRTAVEKGIKLSDEYFFALVHKIKTSPILDEIKDNSTQFALSSEQTKFLAKFMELYPDKAIDMQLSSVCKEIDYQELLKAIQSSEFLSESNNLSLRWMIDNYEDIVEKKKYQTYSTLETGNGEVVKMPAGRNYTRDELNSLIQSVDEVVI